MKKFLQLFMFYFFFVISFHIGISGQQKKETSAKPDTSILICYSESTSYYHKSPSCPSISKCNNMQKVSLDDAINKYHRTACRNCVLNQSTKAH